ncbi:unnamed protein product [Paramecium octaurelia]|uniref:Uncharacterized protein n=1 Tax=Paramecium octaurelia TaxID=43137 RepID=A0A8S1TS06_PAROT|nr:unnamed protein product [Paramecium octaurelia]
MNESIIQNQMILQDALKAELFKTLPCLIKIYFEIWFRKESTEYIMLKKTMNTCKILQQSFNI